MSRNRSLAVALAVLASIALVACGGSSKHSHSSGDGGGKQQTTRTTTTTTAPVASRPIATVDGVQHGEQSSPYRVSVYDLRREGPYVVLDFGITCQAPTSVGCDTRFEFSLPLSSAVKSAGVNEPSGITLVDPVTDKEYGVVYDAQLHPQASELPFQSIGDTSEHLAWVKFPAPASTTQALDVVFPHDGPQIPNVPLSDSPATLPTNLGPDGTAAKPGASSQTADSMSTAGMTLPITNLITTDGNAAGSDAESANKASITLRTDVLFAFGKSNLTSRAHAILTPLAAKIKSRAVGPVQVTGYTDSIGTDQVNIPLSHARAAAVVAALKPALPGATFHATGLGSSDPVAPNTKPDGSDNPAGRALNRRVTISFAVKTQTTPTPPASTPATAPGQAATARTVDFHVPGSDNRWQVAINGLYREGNLAVMKLSISCTLQAGCDGANDFIGSQSVPPITFTQNFLAQGFSAFWSLGGFYLTDPTTGTAYIPVYQGEADPLTSLIGANMATGDAWPAWIYLSAPPPSTTAVAVSLPGGSPKIADVPITAAPSAAGG